MKRIIGLFCILSLGLAGCSSGSKCEKAADKAMELAVEMATAMAGAMGEVSDEMKRNMEERLADKKKKLDAQKPEAIKKCEEALKANPEIEKMLDCLLEAKDVASIAKCDGVEQFADVLK